MNKLITEHLATWTTAPKGIKKLRELILELAVRGLLVPQDPNDEPASELLKKIAAEKARLVSDGKIKRQISPNPPFSKGGTDSTLSSSAFLKEVTASAPPFEKGGLGGISKNEQPFALPMGWEWTKLGEITQINPRNEADDKLEVSFVPMALISTSHKGEHEQEKRYWDEIKKSFTHFAEGDIGVAKITPCFENSKAAVFSGLYNGYGAGTTELHIARPFNKTLISRYVLIYFKSPQFLLIGETKMTGTAGQKRLSKDFVANNPFPLPPLAEQQRIVAKVDELMQLCDQLEEKQSGSQAMHRQLVSCLLTTLTEATDAQAFSAAWSRIAANFDCLFTTEHSIEQLKQTILQLAVMGKLVPQNPNDEPASELLNKIATEKARLITEGKIRKQNPLPKISEQEKPFALPNGWEWVRLQNILDVRDGTHDSPKSATGENTYPLVTSKDFDNGIINFDSARRISAQDHFEIAKRSYVEQFDILFSMIGGNIGNQVMVKVDKPFGIKNVALFKYYNIEFTLPFYIKKITEHLALDLQAKAAGGAQPFVGLGYLRNIVIALPPINEQHRIVAKVDELMTLCEQLKTKLILSSTLQQQLAETLVQQAVA